MPTQHPKHSRIYSRKTDRDCVLFVGNLGVGNSTLLNGLVGRYQFEAGFNVGTGMSDQFAPFEHNGVSYCDSPALSDTGMRELAAKEIKKALQQDGKYRLFFVITLRRGRLQTDDAATMALVLQAIEQRDSFDCPCSFSVIINRISTDDWEFLTPEVKERLRRSIQRDVTHRGSANGTLVDMFFIKELNPGPNPKQVLNIDERIPSFRSFVDNAAVFNIQRDCVNDIQWEGYTKLTIQMERSFREMYARLDQAEAQMQDRKDQEEAERALRVAMAQLEQDRHEFRRERAEARKQARKDKEASDEAGERAEEKLEMLEDDGEAADGTGC